MSYSVDVQLPHVALVPCAFVPSANAPGKTLMCRESDGASAVVEPNGTQVRWVLPSDPNFDSPWTQGLVMSGFLVYRSSTPTDSGVPRGYRMIV